MLGFLISFFMSVHVCASSTISMIIINHNCAPIQRYDSHRLDNFTTIIDVKMLYLIYSSHVFYVFNVLL